MKALDGKKTRMLRSMLKRLWQESWCPPIPDTPDDPTENDRWSRRNHDEWFSTAGEYFLPARQPRRTSSLVATGEIDPLTSIQDKFAKLFYDNCSRTVVARAYRDPRSSLSGCCQKLHYSACRKISEVFVLADATCETWPCFLYATYWFRPFPVKVVVTNQPHSRPNAGIDLVSGVSALLAWFPGSWASKVAQSFIGDAGGATQLLQEVAIQCPNREGPGATSSQIY